MIYFIPYPCPPIPFFQVGAFGETLLAYATNVEGNTMVPPLAPALPWYFVPAAALDLQGIDGIMNVLPRVDSALVAHPAVLPGGALPPQWIGGGTGVFLPTPPFMLSTAYQTPISPPRRAVSRPAAGKKVKKTVKLDKGAGPSKVTKMQNHVKKAAATKETQPEPDQKGKNKEVVKEEEEAAATVDDFPELLLLPEEWTY